MENTIYQKGDIIYVRGSIEFKAGIQGGNIRPYLIISNNKFNRYSPVLTCVPLSTKIYKQSPVHLFIDKSIGIPKNSVVLCEQIHTISKCDIVNYVCSLPDKLISELNELLSFQLSL